MKKLLFFILLFLSSHSGYSQAYISMPADSAVWRYRMYNIDYITQVVDCIIFVNGTDTVAYGHTYHKLISRSCIRTVPNDSFPPMTSMIATSSDIYYGAIRDSAGQVFQLVLSGEQLMFDNNAVVGTSVPAYSGTDIVTAIDSVLLGGIYHKRFLTNDSTYSVIEGIGSNRGLIPNINDGGGDVQFVCFTDAPVLYSPNSTVPCTYVYPVGYISGIYNINQQDVDIKIFPVPAFDMLHITSNENNILYVTVFSSIGQVIWKGELTEKQDIPVSTWPEGLYYVQITGGKTGRIVKKVIVQ